MTTPDYAEICSRVEQIARQAGAYIAESRRGFSFGDVEFKGAHDMVSYVDKNAERMIVSALREVIPGAGFITEEGTAGEKGEKFKWIIDPLDGTTNFVHGLPPYCTSIALMEGDRIVVGVIYEATLGEMFCSWEGGPALMNGEPIRASGTEKLENSLVAVGFSHSALSSLSSGDQFLKDIVWYQQNTDGIRRLGSAAMDLAYVACGRVDAFFQSGLKPWDVAAGAFIAAQAGGVVSDYRGGGDYIFGREIVAAAPGVYREFMLSRGETKESFNG